MLDGDLHLVAFAEECKDGVLVGGPSDVVRVDLEDSVAHAQLARVGCGATGDDLHKEIDISGSHHNIRHDLCAGDTDNIFQMSQLRINRHLLPKKAR